MTAITTHPDGRQGAPRAAFGEKAREVVAAHPQPACHHPVVQESARVASVPCERRESSTATWRQSSPLTCCGNSS